MNSTAAPRRRLLLVVEYTIAVAGRGLVVVPAADLGPQGQRRVWVELRRPDGTTCRTDALAQVPFVVPLSHRQEPGARHVLFFTAVSKQDVPVGTEVWMDEEA